MLQYGQLLLSVTDSGAGMTQEQLKNLFKEGVQFNARELQHGGGSGLGLWISKGIIEKHNGTLSARSEGLGRGTTFELTIPLHRARNVELSDSPQTTEDTETSKIPFVSSESSVLRLLVVDDVSSNRKLLRRLLEMRGHVCEDAENGQIALDKIMEGGASFDCVLMDFEIPVMDGPTATKAIRSSGFDMFVVGVTGNMLSEDVQFFRECGANAVVGKPVNLDTLENLWVEYGLLSGNEN